MSIWGQVKAAVDLEVLVVEACGPGQHRGSATFFSAPWRSDSSPSLALYTDNDPHWWDYGEGIGGDVIDLVCRWRGLKKGAALRWLKERAGIEGDDPTPEQVERYTRRDNVRDALTIAAHWFFERWEDSDEIRALRTELLNQHYGWTGEIVDALKIGWVPIYEPSKPGLWDHLTSRGVTPDTISELHLFVAYAGRQRAEGRIAFPYWSGGKVSYFTFRETRLSNSGAGAKYIKLQEGEVVRNPAFWGWDPRPRNERPKRSWTPVAEGVADAISVAMLGLPVISPVTTKFAADDLIKVKKAAADLGRLVLVPDQEASGAGMAGAISTCVALAAEGVEARIAVLPHEVREGAKWKVDANEWIRDLMRSGLSAEGARARLDELCEGAPPLLDLLVSNVPASARGVELTALLKPIAACLATTEDDLELDRVATVLNGRLGRGAPKKSIVEALKKARAETIDEIKKREPKPELPDGAFKRGDAVEIADRLIGDLGGADNVVFDEGALHQYSGEQGVWVPLDVAALHKRVGSYAGMPKGWDKELSLSREGIKGARAQAEDMASNPGWLRDCAPGFAFKNGFVQIESDGNITLKPHAREHRAVFRYDFDWDPDREPTELIKFYAEVFRDDPEAADKTQFLLEFYGASLIGEAWRGGKAIIKYGPGNDGKSVETQIMQAVFPSGSLAAVSPHVWEEAQMLAKLAGKRLNYAGELSAKELRESAIVKAVITGRDPVTAKVVYRPPFDFYTRSGNIMTANPPLPAVSDVSRGFWRRWEIVEFTRSFEPHEENPNIVEDVTADPQAIAVTLIKAAAQFVANGSKYTRIPGSSELLRSEWMTGSEPVRRWVNEQCKPAAPGEGFTADLLWSNFKSWAQAHGHANMSSATFRGRVTTIVRDLVRTDKAWAEAAGRHVAEVKKLGAFTTKAGEATVQKFPVQFKLQPGTEISNGDFTL